MSISDLTMKVATRKSSTAAFIDKYRIKFVYELLKDDYLKKDDITEICTKAEKIIAASDNELILDTNSAYDPLRLIVGARLRQFFTSLSLLCKEPDGHDLINQKKDDLCIDLQEIIKLAEGPNSEINFKTVNATVDKLSSRIRRFLNNNIIGKVIAALLVAIIIGLCGFFYTIDQRFKNLENNIGITNLSNDRKFSNIENLQNETIKVEINRYLKEFRKILKGERNTAKEIDQLRKKMNLYILDIHVSPEDSQIKITNILQKYEPKIILNPGDYKIEISAVGYNSKIIWVEIKDEDVTLEVELEKDKSK